LISICFVCLGNICRSPTAEVVMRHLLEQERLADEVQVSSAGTGDWHVGEGMDSRSLQALTERSYDGRRHRARQWRRSWFDDHDLIVAMDRSNERALRAMASPAQRQKIRLLMSWVPDAADLDVPDPYYGGQDGFAAVIELVERGCRALLADVRPSLPR
jgi:protein-tyrosine phosphatase